MLKICISGYGKMGKSIENMAQEKGHKIQCIVDKHEDWDLKSYEIQGCDVIIDFSMPTEALFIIKRACELGIPLITGTTGWLNKIDEVKNLVEQHQAKVVYASNFSIGMNILFKLNEHLARMMNEFEEYIPSMTESHHKQKLDSPSGTAISLADDLIRYNNKIESWVNTTNDEASILPIHSIREDGVVGIHDIVYKSEVDQIRIGHEAFNRLGFTSGALYAAERIDDVSGLVEFKDLLNLNT